MSAKPSSKHFVINDDIDLLAAAIKKAAAQHGLPNSFGCQELHKEHGGPRPLQAGKIGHRYRLALYVAIGKGFTFPIYEAGAFKIGKAVII